MITVIVYLIFLCFLVAALKIAMPYFGVPGVVQSLVWLLCGLLFVIAVFHAFGIWTPPFIGK